MTVISPNDLISKKSSLHESDAGKGQQVNVFTQVYVFMSYPHYQVLPKPLNPECAVSPSVQRRPPQGRVLWPCEPSSAYCLSYKENTTDKDRSIGLR